MTLEKLTAIVEEGLQKWPDGNTAICIINNEPYQTFALGYTIGQGFDDSVVMAEMRNYFERIKTERAAKYISWRKPFEWVERAVNRNPLVGDTQQPKLLTMPQRALRCRVLITANTNDPDWLRECDPEYVEDWLSIKPA